MSDLACTNRGSWHLRGRILPPTQRAVHERERAGRWVMWRKTFVCDHFWFEVVNTRTGKVVYRSDAFGWDEAVRECSRAVGVIRWAWAMDVRRKELA